MHNIKNKFLLIPILLGILISGCGIIKLVSKKPTTSMQRKLEALTTIKKGDTTLKLSIEQPHDTFSVPLACIAGFYFFNTTINGVKYRTLLDYGDNYTFGLFPSSVIKSQSHLINDTGHTAESASGITKIERGIASKIQIENGPVINNVPFFMSPEDSKVKLFGLISVFSVKSTIGMELLSKFSAFTLDMGNKRLFLNEVPKAVTDNQKTVRIPCYLDTDYQMSMNGTMDSVPVQFHLDLSGTSGGLILWGEAAKKLMKTHKYIDAGQTGSMFGNGKSRIYFVTIADIKIGNYERKDVQVELMPDTHDTGCSMGDGFFGISVIGIDQRKDILYYLKEK